MLERLRLKRNSSKTQAGARSGGRGKDTRLADASRRGGSSSRSNSTGKDAEPAQDLATGQQPSPLRRDPTDSGEGVESGPAAGRTMSRPSAATSAATASSLPGPSQHHHHHSQQDHQPPLPHPQHQQQVLLKRRPRQEPPSPRGEKGEIPFAQGGLGGSAAGPPRGGAVDQQELLRIYFAQESALLQPRRNPPATGGAAADTHLAARAAAGALARDVRMVDCDSDPQPDGGGGRGAAAPRMSLYHDAPYGVPPGMAGGGGASSAAAPMGVREAAAAMEILSHRAQHPQPGAAALPEQPPRRRDRGEILVELASGTLDDSLLLQLAIPRGNLHATAGGGSAAGGAGGPSGRVLDLGQPPAAGGPVLNLSSRVDLSLELQLQDIYREMAISDLAPASSPLAQQQHSLLLQQQQHHQGAPLRSNSSAPLFTRNSASEALLPLGAQARHGQQQRQPSSSAALLSGHSLYGLHSTASTPPPAASLTLSGLRSECGGGGLALRPSPQPAAQSHLQLPATRLPPGPHHALSELAVAMRLGGNRDMDVDVKPLSMASRLPHAVADFGPTSQGANAAASSDPMQLLQQQQQPQHQFTSGASGIAASQHPDGSRSGAPRHSGDETALSDRRAYGAMHVGAEAGTGPFGMGLAPADGAGAGNHFHGSGGAYAMAAIPEAGDGCTGGWCSGDEVDAALDMLMEDAGSGAVYHAGNHPPTLERICFKLNNVHPYDLPRDLLGTMGSWLAAARAEVVQGAIRPGCTQLILDVYAHGPDVEIEVVEDVEAAGVGPWPPPPPPPAPPVAAPPQPAATEAQDAEPKAAARGGRLRILGRLQPSENELASLEAAAAAAGAEALQPVEESSSRACGVRRGMVHSAEPSSAWTSSAGGSEDGPSRAGGSGGGDTGGSGTAQSNAAHLSSCIMHGGNVRAAAAAFKKLLGPRAVQSMSVTVSHEVLTISGRDMGRYVADVRGTMAGLDTPLLLSTAPLAVVAGARCEIRVVGAHLAGPGRRPQIRWQGHHVPCGVVPRAEGDFEQLRPVACGTLVGKLMDTTLPGSHRAEAVAACKMFDVQLEAPDVGLMMLEWEADRPTGVAISNWLPVLSVPDAAMADEINRHLCVEKDAARADRELHPFLTDLGLVLDYVTRVNQHVLMPISVLMAEQGVPGLEADDPAVAAQGVDAALGRGLIRGAAGSSAVGATSEDYTMWLSRGGGGGEDQRVSFLAADGVSGLDGEEQEEEHDSLTELMARPRLSKKHHNRVAALTPGLLAFAADSGMAAVMSWLMDFMLEHVHFGDLAAVLQSVEPVSVCAAASGLPLLHRVVRSGNEYAVRLLLQRAASHGLACNVAQPAGPYRITPLHLAALQPLHSGMLQACGCTDPAVADLWVTVVDAAGRTPAMYLRRKLESAARAAIASSSAATRAAGTPAVAAVTGPMQPRSSTSGSTTAYRSWGSEDPVDAPVVTGTITSTMMLPDVPTESHASCEAGRRQPRDALTHPSFDGSGSEGEDGMIGLSDVVGGEQDRLLDSVEDFRERRTMRQRGMRLADAVLAGLDADAHELHGAVPAAALAGSAAMPAPSPAGGGDAPWEPQPQWGQAAMVAADGSAPQEENGQAPLQAKAPAALETQVGSGAARGTGACLLSTEMVTAAVAAAMGPQPTEATSAALAAAVVEASGSACCYDSSPPAGSQQSEFFGDSMEDWLALRRDLRARRRLMRLEEQQRQAQQQDGQFEAGGGPAAHARKVPVWADLVPGARHQLRVALAIAVATLRTAVVAARAACGALSVVVREAAAGGCAGVQAVLVAVAVASLLIAGLLAARAGDAAV